MASDTPNLDPQDRRSEIAAPAPNGEDHAQPVRRGKGRPPGSRNKPKSARQPGTAQPGGDNPATSDPAKLHPTVEEAVLKAAHGNGRDPGAKVTVADITTDNVFDNLHVIRKTEPTALVAETPVEVVMAVRKPKNKEFFKVCPDREMSITMTTYVRKIEGSFEEEFWTVLPNVEGFLAEMDEGRQVQLLLCQTDKGINFFWPLPITEGGDRPHVTSARAAARIALTKWVRIKWRKADATYQVFEKKNQSQEAAWPADSLSTLLKRAFGKRIIDSVEHEVIQKDLYGEDGKPKGKDGKPASDSWI